MTLFRAVISPFSNSDNLVPLAISEINDDTLKFANKLHIEDRLGKFKMKDAYTLFIDHKPNLWRCPWCNGFVVGNGHGDTSSNPGRD